MRYSLRIVAFTVLFLSSAARSNADDSVSCGDLSRIATAVTEIRGLKFKKAVPCREVDINNGEFLRYKQQQFAKLYPQDSLKLEGILYKLLGLIPNDYDYAGCAVQGATADVLASYDNDIDTIILPKSLSTTSDVLAHELVHALQSQYFSLNRLQQISNKATESALAFAALAEGDAMLVQRRYIKQFAAQSQKDQPETAQKVPNACDLPLTLVKLFDFPYSFGLLFSQRMYESGGFEKLNKAYSRPPTTTGEIIHLDRYPLSSPMTAKLKFPGGGSHPDGRLVHEDHIGQYVISLLLADGVGKETAIIAAKGLVRDDARIYRDKDHYSLEWISLWEDAADADQFKQALMASMEKRFGLKLEKSANSVSIAPGAAANISIRRADAAVALAMSGIKTD